MNHKLSGDIPVKYKFSRCNIIDCTCPQMECHYKMYFQGSEYFDTRTVYLYNYEDIYKLLDGWNKLSNIFKYTTV